MMMKVMMTRKKMRRRMETDRDDGPTIARVRGKGLEKANNEESNHIIPSFCFFFLPDLSPSNFSFLPFSLLPSVFPHQQETFS